MKKVIRDVDEKRGIVQATFADERWYFKPGKDKEGIPVILAVPSVTWVAGHYPKGVPFYKWLANNGWDEAEAIKAAAGDKGSKIHLALVDVLDGNEVKIDSKYLNPSTGVAEELTLEECDAILSFKRWVEEMKPITVAREIVVFSEQHNYAGTVDFICKIGDKFWLIDFKTGQNIWPEYELQVSAYEEALSENENAMDALKAAGWKGELINLGILQLGYKRNKNEYKFTEIENKFKLFLAAQQIWANENEGVEPKRKDYPIVLSPAQNNDKSQLDLKGKSTSSVEGKQGILSEKTPMDTRELVKTSPMRKLQKGR